MGSCSSGGPNKLTAMCLVKGGELSSKREEQSKFIGREVLMVHRNCPNRPFDHPSPSDTTIVSDSKGRMDNYVSTSCPGRSGAVGGGGGGGNARKSGVVFPRRNELMIGADGHHCTSSTGDGCLSDDAFRNDNCGARRSISQPCSSNAAIIQQTDSQRRRREYERRKASALLDLYQWNGEYRTCIVPPPNKTVFDALLSPCGRGDYSDQSGWAMCWKEEEEVDRTPLRSTTPVGNGNNGYNMDGKRPSGIPAYKNATSHSSQNIVLPVHRFGPADQPSGQSVTAQSSIHSSRDQSSSNHSSTDQSSIHSSTGQSSSIHPPIDRSVIHSTTDQSSIHSSTDHSSVHSPQPSRRKDSTSAAKRSLSVTGYPDTPLLPYSSNVIHEDLNDHQRTSEYEYEELSTHHHQSGIQRRPIDPPVSGRDSGKDVNQCNTSTNRSTLEWDTTSSDRTERHRLGHSPS